MVNILFWRKQSQGISLWWKPGRQTEQEMWFSGNIMVLKNVKCNAFQQLYISEIMITKWISWCVWYLKIYFKNGLKSNTPVCVYIGGCRTIAVQSCWFDALEDICSDWLVPMVHCLLTIWICISLYIVTYKLFLPVYFSCQN